MECGKNSNIKFEKDKNETNWGFLQKEGQNKSLIYFSILFQPSILVHFRAINRHEVTFEFYLEKQKISIVR